MMQEWEAFTGQVLVDLKVDTTQISDGVPKWLEEDKAFEVFLLKVWLLSAKNCSYVKETNLLYFVNIQQVLFIVLCLPECTA